MISGSFPLDHLLFLLTQFTRFIEEAQSLEVSWQLQNHS